MRNLVLAIVMAVAVSFTGTAIAADGAKVYKSKCASCHGKDGKGTAMAPAHAGSDYIKSASAADIKADVVNGRKGSAKKYKKFPIPMPPWKGKLTDAEIDAVVAYMKGL